MGDHQAPNDSFSIRYATVQDIPLIRELTFQVWPQTYRSILTAEQISYMLEMMYSPDSLAQQMADGSRFIIVYEQDKPVGFASYKETGDTIYQLDKIYILPAQQGKGTGKFLLSYIEQQITQAGGKALRLRVNRHNTPAISFYDNNGFNIIEEADFDIGNGYFMNDYIMEKKTKTG